MSRFPARLAVLSALIACVLPLAATAQSGGGGSDGGGASSDEGESKGSRGGSRRVSIQPYIEAAQIVTAELSPGDDVLTYTSVAAGIDAQITGVNNAVAASLRYEHRFGWGKADDGDTISGVVRGYATVAPGLRIDAGALAARSRIDEDGTAILGPLDRGDSTSNLYSLFVGPTLGTEVGDVSLTATYRFGYTKVEQPDSFRVSDGTSVDVFDDSTIHVAGVRAGIKPYDVLPIGIGVGANYYREDISNLDQRAEDFNARIDVTVPLSPTLALVGGVGYEDVELSARDAVRDPNGVPVFDGAGRYLVDKNSPRLIAYDVEGLIWDAGVMWRPSRRTQLEAHVGRRYGSTSVSGTFGYQPNSRSSLNVAVYDNVAGFGGQVNRALADLPAEFTAIRNPLTGEIGGCVATLEQNGCITNVLGSVRSATFRARGVMATYGYQFGRVSAGVGAGYDRRRFFAAPGTVLAGSNGVIDENYWLTTYINGRIDAQSSWSANLYASWFRPGSGGGGLGSDTNAIGATAAYNRRLTDKLSATAAIGIDGVSVEEPLEDFWTASALLGVRYSF